MDNTKIRVIIPPRNIRQGRFWHLHFEGSLGAGVSERGRALLGKIRRSRLAYNQHIGQVSFK